VGEGGKGEASRILNFSIHKKDRSDLRSGQFTPDQTVRGSHLRDWVTRSENGVEKSNPGRPASHCTQQDSTR
jgi:hypothetical protein